MTSLEPGQLGMVAAIDVVERLPANCAARSEDECVGYGLHQLTWDEITNRLVDTHSFEADLEFAESRNMALK